MLLHEESRFTLVKRWLEWLGREHAVYNVDNAHQCFNEKPRAIIKPFKEENNFYGCVLCGKYHFCYHSHHTCDSIAPTMDINNNMPTCAYSGQTIKNVHNEVIGNYNDVVLFHSDVQHGVSFISSEDAMNTTSVSSSASMDTRRINALENMVFSGSTQKKRSPSKKERRNIDRKDMNQYFFRQGKGLTRPIVHEIDNETCVHERKSTVIDDDVDVDVDDEQDGELNENENESWGMDVEEEDETTIRGIIAKNKRLDREVDIDQWMSGEYDCWERDTTGDDDGTLSRRRGGDDDEEEEDIAAYDDRLTRMKNPHNNIAFWDSYYSFLADTSPVTTLIDTRRATTVDEEDSTNYAINSDIEDEECKRKGGHIYDTSSNSVFKVDTTRWTQAVSLIIEDETRRIIDIILRTSMRQDQKTIEKSIYTLLLDRLTSYYHNIISNIVILVYHSPYIHKLALLKHEKHEKQGKSSYSSKITVSVTDISSFLANNDNDSCLSGSGSNATTANPIDYQYAWDLVCPKKVCASLMLQLFTDTFYLSDNMTNRIHIWVNDPWLSYMKKEVFDDIIMDYNIILDPLNQQKKRYMRKSQQYENIFFKKDLTSMSSIIRTSLSAYNRHPMWLSSMIYSFKR